MESFFENIKNIIENFYGLLMILAGILAGALKNGANHKNMMIELGKKAENDQVVDFKVEFAKEFTELNANMAEMKKLFVRDLLMLKQEIIEIKHRLTAVEKNGNKK